MRPDRIIVGEVRQEECLDLLIALNSGLPGMCSIHANSRARGDRQAVHAAAAGRGERRPRLRRADRRRCVDVVVHTAKDGQGHRRVREIVGGAGPGRGRRRRGGGPVRHARAVAGAGGRLPAAPGALRVGRHRPAARCWRTTAGLTWGRCSGCCSGSGCCWCGSPATRRPVARRADPADVAAADVASCWCRPASRASRRRSWSAASAGARAGRRRCWCSGPRRCRAIGGAVRRVRGAAAAAARPAPPGAARGRAARGVARGGRQPGQRRARRAVAAGGADAARRPRAGAAALAVPPVRRGLPGDRPVRREPRPAQGRPGRPGRRPGRRGAADGARGRRHRPRPAAADAVELPARGRPHPRGARDAAGLDGQRRPAGPGRAVGAAAPAVDAARRGAGLQHRRPARSCCSSAAGCRSSPTG